MVGCMLVHSGSFRAVIRRYFVIMLYYTGWRKVVQEADSACQNYKNTL